MAASIAIIAPIIVPPSAFSWGIFSVLGLKIRLNEIILILMLSVVVIKNIKIFGEVGVLWKRLNFIFIAALSLFAFSIFFTKGNMGLSIESLVLFSISSYGSMVLCYFAVNTEKDVNNILITLLIVGSLVSAIGIWEIINQKYFYVYYLGVDPIIKTMDQYSVQRAASALLNPNPFGAFMVLIVPIGFALYLNMNNIVNKLLVLIISLILFVGVVVSFSRGAWLGGFVVLILFTYFNRNLTSLVKLGIITIGIICVLNLYIPLVRPITDRLTKQSTIESVDFLHRVVSYKTTLNIMSERPFSGVGFGQMQTMFSSVKDPRAENIGTLDNIYLRLFCETGIIGSLPFAILIGYLLILPWIKGLMVKYRDPNTKVVLGIWTGLVGIIVCGLTFDTFIWTSISVPFWGLSGILVKILEKDWSIV